MLITLVAKWFINALALLLVAYLAEGVHVDSFYTALIVALLLGVINAVIRPIFFVLTLPITILTLGLFTFILNGFFFWFLATFVDGFAVDGFWWAVLGAIIVSVFSWMGNQFILGKDEQ